MQSATEDLSPVLPDYFPSLTRECQKAGLVFFHCFSEQSKHKGTEVPLICATISMIECLLAILDAASPVPDSFLFTGHPS
jgi:hypothetical protein